MTAADTYCQRACFACWATCGAARHVPAQRDLAQAAQRVGRRRAVRVDRAAARARPGSLHAHAPADPVPLRTTRACYQRRLRSVCRGPDLARGRASKDDVAAPASRHSRVPGVQDLPATIMPRSACAGGRWRSDPGGLAAVFGAIRRVLEQREWSSAFDRDGYGVAQNGVSQRVLRELRAAVPPTIASTRPTEAQLHACFPRNRRPRADVVWRALSQAGAPGGVVAASGAPAVGGVVVGAAPGPRRSVRLAAKRARSGCVDLLPATILSSASASSSTVAPLAVVSVGGASSSGVASGLGDGGQIMTRSRTKSLRTG